MSRVQRRAEGQGSRRIKSQRVSASLVGPLGGADAGARLDLESGRKRTSGMGRGFRREGAQDVPGRAAEGRGQSDRQVPASVRPSEVLVQGFERSLQSTGAVLLGGCLRAGTCTWVRRGGRLYHQRTAGARGTRDLCSQLGCTCPARSCALQPARWSVWVDPRPRQPISSH